VKTVKLTGRLNRFGRWDLALVITVGEYTSARNRSRTRGCRVNLGWAKVDDDNVRVATAFLPDGSRKEFVLPLAFKLRGTRHCFVPKDALVRSSQDSANYQRLAEAYAQQIDHLLEDTKAEIKRLLVTGAERSCARSSAAQVEIRKKLSHIALMRDRGLHQLRSLLTEEKQQKSHSQVDRLQLDAALKVLNKWADKTANLRRSKADVDYRFMARRKHLYQEWAKQLCEEFGTIELNNVDLDAIAAEPNVDLSKLEGEAKTQEAITRSAARNRQLVSISEFKHWLQNAADKYGTTVSDPDAAKRKAAKDNRPPVSGVELDHCFVQGNGLRMIASGNRSLVAEAELRESVEQN
jgi:hypothetical protein